MRNRGIVDSLAVQNPVVFLEIQEVLGSLPVVAAVAPVFEYVVPARVESTVEFQFPLRRRRSIPQMQVVDRKAEIPNLHFRGHIL